MPVKKPGLPEPAQQRWRELYRNSDYRALPWFSRQPFPWVAEAVSKTWIARGSKVLDVGCGAGTNSLFLARSGYRVAGIDLAPAAIEAAKGRAARQDLRVDFRVADVLRLPFPRGHFGGAIDIGCFHTLPVNLRSQYEAELARVVRPGGRFAIAWAAREFTASLGPPHRLSLEEGAAVLEGRFQFLRTAFLSGWKGRISSYGALLERRVGRQPPPR